MDKKFELIPSDIEGLFRVKALKDFGNVKRCDIGGYIQSEYNLSHDGNCWIYDNAAVMGNAKVWGNAQIYNNAVVRGCAIVRDNAVICDNARVYDNAKVYDNAIVRDNAQVCNNARVYDNARIYDNVEVWDDAQVCGNASVWGRARICGDAIISSNKDYIIFKNWWSSGRYFTWTRSNNMWKVGCFYGTGEELIAKAYKDSEESGREYECIVKYVERILNS